MIIVDRNEKHVSIIDGFSVIKLYMLRVVPLLENEFVRQNIKTLKSMIQVITGGVLGLMVINAIDEDDETSERSELIAAKWKGIKELNGRETSYKI